jgi:hypothetical protein
MVDTVDFTASVLTNTNWFQFRTMGRMCVGSMCMGFWRSVRGSYGKMGQYIEVGVYNPLVKLVG